MLKGVKELYKEKIVYEKKLYENISERIIINSPYKSDLKKPDICLLSQILDAQPLCRFNNNNILGYINYLKIEKLKLLKFRILYNEIPLIIYNNQNIEICEDNKLCIYEKYFMFKNKLLKQKIEKSMNTSCRKILRNDLFIYRKFLGDFLIGIDCLINNCILGTKDVTSLFCLFPLIYENRGIKFHIPMEKDEDYYGLYNFINYKNKRIVNNK